VLLLLLVLGVLGGQVAGRALKDSEHIAQKADDLVDAFSPSAPFS
jgi:hypothetical protein